jgi:hypothetical protein
MQGPDRESLNEVVRSLVVGPGTFLRSLMVEFFSHMRDVSFPREVKQVSGGYP